MYAVIAEGGGQRKVEQGEVILVDLIDGGEAKAGTKITFDKVLLLGGGSIKVGQPLVAGAKVEAEVVEGLVKGDKIYIQKWRRRKAHDKKTGHRQTYTKVKITSIAG
ncbi:MAG: 50S ribosomal protein L21 [Phycisphaerales bacterium]|nr:50S ribosomal protein L21 [Phycisphaerales bacterium]